MKKLLILCISTICLLITHPAYAIDTKNCDYLTGGAQRSLDYMSVDDLNDGDRAIVVYTGSAPSGSSTYIGYFKYRSSGVTAENTTIHPFYVRPDDFATQGVWEEIVANWVDLEATLEITNLTVTGTNTVVNLDASGQITGTLPTHNVTSSETLSGTTLRGGFIGNYGATSAVTYTFAAAIKGMSCNVSLDQDQTSGSTIWAVMNTADEIINQPNFNTSSGAGTGVSCIKLSGATGAGSFTFKAVEDNVWRIYEEGVVQYVDDGNY